MVETAALRATVFSNFPPRLVREVVAPKLRERGVEVVHIEKLGHAGRAQLLDVDVVLAMHEKASHAERDRARFAAASAGKRYLTLSRKASSWPDFRKGMSVEPQTQIQQGEVSINANPTLELLLREYVELWEDGSPTDEIAAQVRHYPLTPPVRTAGQLSALIQRVLKAGEPLWFHKWWDEERLINRNAVPSRACPPPSRPVLLDSPPASAAVVASPKEPEPLREPEPEPEITTAAEPEPEITTAAEPEPVVAPVLASIRTRRRRTTTDPKRRTTMKGSITAEDMPKFCDDFRSLFERGVSTADMVPKLKKYFKNPAIPLVNPNQIYNLTRVITVDGRAPESFTEWYERRNNGEPPAARTAKKKEVSMAAVKHVVSTNGHANGHANGAITKPAHAPGREDVREVSAALDVLQRHAVLDHASAWKLLMGFVG